MTDITSEQKSQLRSRCRAIRSSLGVEKRAQASFSICREIEAWRVFRQSAVILAYMPVKSEADLTPLFDLHPQKKWVLPRIIPEEDNRMVFHPYDARTLIRHPFGMSEPAPDSPLVSSSEIELTLAPGLAFDRLGWRLGYGGGYFDRFLKGFNGVSAGVAFHDLLLEEIPRSEHDIPMNWIVTERGVFAARQTSYAIMEI